MIIQGSNNPLVIQFDASVASIPALVVTLWSDSPGRGSQMVKKWELGDMTIDDDTAVCPITEAETKAFPSSQLILEAKGLDGDENTIFWDQYPLDVKRRRDKIIQLTQTEG